MKWPGPEKLDSRELQKSRSETHRDRAQKAEAGIGKCGGEAGGRAGLSQQDLTDRGFSLRQRVCIGSTLRPLGARTPGKGVYLDSHFEDTVCHGGDGMGTAGHIVSIVRKQ